MLVGNGILQKSLSYEYFDAKTAHLQQFLLLFVFLPETMIVSDSEPFASSVCTAGAKMVEF